MSQKYRNDLQTRLEVQRQENERQDTPWKSIAKAFKETARDAVGFQRIQQDSVVIPNNARTFPKKKQKVAKESNQNKEQRRELNKERNKTLKQPKKELQNGNDKQVDSELQDIEK